MASNFRILAHRNSDNLHLKLAGDFDDSSAWELLNMLKENCRGASKVIIHTNSLKKVHPFGRDTFQQNFRDMKGHSLHILFTGDHAYQISPEKDLCM